MLRPLLSVSVLTLALASTQAHAGAKIEGVEVKPGAERIDVVVKASEPLTFQSWSRSAPPTVVIDLLDATADAKDFAGSGVLTGVSLTRHDGRGAQLSRVSLNLKNAVDYDVTAKGNEITVALFLTKKAASDFTTKKPAVLAMNTARGSQGDASDAPKGIVEGSLGRATSDVELAQADGPRAMTYIGFKNTAASSKVYARLNAEAKFTVRKEGDNLIVLEIQNAKIPLRNNKNHLDATFFESPVKMITPSEVEDATPTVRITIEMKGAVPYDAKLEGREIVVTFKK
jgi:hypothetical protein